VQITALDLSARSLAFGHHKLHHVWPQETARRVRFAVADLLALPAANLPPFELAAAIGVLHHVSRPDVPRALHHLVQSLKPGGVLQLGTYSTIGIASWWAPTRRLLHRLAPSLVSPMGELMRQPAPYELRELRSSVMDLDRRNGHEDGAPISEEERLARAHVVRCAEFYTSTGCRDLMLHPCECSFTLLELRALLDAADLDLVGMWFGNLDVDRRAREAYVRSAAASGGYAQGDGPDRQIDMLRWHALEEAQPDLFGRMHVLFAQRRVR
jgi:SAM-dependent methyltransferase